MLTQGQIDYWLRRVHDLRARELLGDLIQELQQELAECRDNVGE